MPQISRPFAALAACTLLSAAGVAVAKDITLPPSGDNQFSSVTQGIGLVRVTIEYSSPNVHAPDGRDRAGHIWGELVPYGLHDLGYNNCKQCPWRGGANENTVFTVSHPVKVEGQELPAGSYGLFFLAGKDEWTVIFSKNFKSWGAFWYDPAEDQLRVQVKPSECEYHEWLTYEFTDRERDHATVALKWERLQVPIRITVDDMPGLYVVNLRQEFRNAQAFKWQTFREAAIFCLVSKSHLDQGLLWAQEAVSRPGTGVENLQTLSVVAELQLALGRTQEGQRTMDRALAMPDATPIDVHGIARFQQMQGDPRDGEADLPPERQALPEPVAGERGPGPLPRDVGRPQAGDRPCEEGDGAGAGRGQSEEPREPHPAVERDRREVARARSAPEKPRQSRGGTETSPVGNAGA